MNDLILMDDIEQDEEVAFQDTRDRTPQASKMTSLSD